MSVFDTSIIKYLEYCYIRIRSVGGTPFSDATEEKPNSNILTGRETTETPYVCVCICRHRDINKEYSNSADRRNTFALRFSKTWDTSVFRRNSRDARPPSFAGSEGKESARHSPFCSPYSTSLPPSRRWWHRCMCVGVSSVFIPLPQQHGTILLTTYLTRRPSALSSPRSGLMAFENSNIIRRSILSPLRTQGRPRGRKISRILAIPFLSKEVSSFLESVLNLILVGSDSVNNVSIGHRDSHSITCRECRYTVLITRHSVNSCQSFSRRRCSRARGGLGVSDSGGMIEKIDLKKVLSFKVSNT